MLVSLAAVSCDNYEAPEITSLPAVTIVSRDTNFPASASTGSIQFKADGAVTVTTDNSWITATVEGDVIKISCTQNDKLSSRTGLLVIQCNGRKTEVSVIQDGMIFQIPGVDTLSFSAEAGSQAYALKANAPIEITSDYDWLSGAVVDGELVVTVADNASLDGRQGALKITYGDNSAVVPVSQAGFYIALFDLDQWNVTGASNSTKSYSYKLSIPVEFTTDSPDWIGYELNTETQVLKFTLQKNETGHMREGSFSYAIGEKTGTVSVRQCNFATDLAGDGYGLYFTDPSDGKVKGYRASLVKDGSAYSIVLPDLDFTIPVTYNSSTLAITINAGQFCGKYSSYFVYTTVGYTKDGKGYMSWTDAPAYTGVPYYEFDEEDNAGYTTVEFEDAGAFAYPLDYIDLFAFTAEAMSADTRAGYLVRMVDPFLMRVHQTAGEPETQGAPAKAPRAAQPIAAKAAAAKSAVKAVPALTAADSAIAK